MKLICSYCGYTEEINDNDFIPYRAEYEQAHKILCNHRLCTGKHSRVANGQIRLVFWFGSWSIDRPVTLEEYRGIRRARELRHLMLKSKFGK